VEKGLNTLSGLPYTFIQQPLSILLVTIYSKSDREDIGANEIRDILADFSSKSG